MSGKQWSSTEKMDLMRQYASGKSFEDIGKNLSRSPNAIKLRLESIVYENLIKGKPATLIIKMLNTNIEMIKQFYYAHKSFLQGRGKDVVDVDFDNIDVRNKKTDVESTVNKMLGTEESNNPLKHRVIPKSQKRDTNNIQKAGGNDQEHKTSHAEKELRRILEENKILEEIIKNYTLKRQIKKLYIDEKLDNRSMTIYEKIFKH